MRDSFLEGVNFQLDLEGSSGSGYSRVRKNISYQEGAKEKLLRGMRMEESLGTEDGPMWHGFQKGEEGRSWKSFRKNYEIKVCKHL